MPFCNSAATLQSIFPSAPTIITHQLAILTSISLISIQRQVYTMECQQNFTWNRTLLGNQIWSWNLALRTVFQVYNMRHAMHHDANDFPFAWHFEARRTIRNKNRSKSHHYVSFERIKVERVLLHKGLPERKVHGANMGPTRVLSVPDGPHVGPRNLAIRDYVTVSLPACSG